MAPTPRPLGLEDLERLAAALPRTAPCSNPSCSNRFRYRGPSRGRARRFCTDACRADYSRQRTRLRSLWADLAWTRTCEPPTVPLQQVAQLQHHVEWLLASYGGLSEDDEDRLLYPEMRIPDLESLPYVQSIAAHLTAPDTCR